MSLAQTSFQILRGENQPSLGDLKISNTPQLLQFAALSGEKVTISLLDETQTAIVQHRVNVLMECSSLIESGGKLLGPVKWTRQSYFEDEDGSLFPQGSEITIHPSSTDRFRAEGELNRFLNITRTNIIQGAERMDNGLYTCTVCTESGCRSASVMLYLIGAPPRLDFAEDDGMYYIVTFYASQCMYVILLTECYVALPMLETSSPMDKKYQIGADFCVERGSQEVIELHCDILGESLAEHMSIPFPTPSRKWFKDDVLIYSVEQIGQSVYRGENVNFYNGRHGILQYGLVLPPPLYTAQDGRLELNFEASKLALTELAPKGTTNQTIVNDVFNALTGSWRCEVENILQLQLAETVITEC